MIWKPYRHTVFRNLDIYYCIMTTVAWSRYKFIGYIRIMNFNIVYICTCTLYMVIMVKARIRRILDREKDMKKIVFRVGTQSSFYNNLFSKNLTKIFFCFQWTQTHVSPHCKEGFAIFPSPWAGMSLSKLSPTGDGKIANLFLQCTARFPLFIKKYEQ